MAVLKDEKRTRFGRSLLDFNNEISNLENRLKAVKTNLQNMKDEMERDGDFALADVIEVTTVLSKVNTVLGVTTTTTV